MLAYVNPDEYRVAGEKTSLYWGFGTLAFVILFVTAISMGLMALVVALAAAWVWIRQGQLLGGCVKVSEQQFPNVYAIAQRAARRLGMQMPEVFVEYSPALNASALGFLGKKSVVINSATIEAMEELELEFIIGHEFSHIKCGHTNLSVLTSSSDSVGIPILSHALKFIFLFWQRKAEYTCDRGGLLANRNPHNAMSAICKLAVGPTLFKQMNIENFLGQQMAIEQSDISKLSENLATHPYLVKRIHALREFFFSREYDRIVSRVDTQDDTIPPSEEATSIDTTRPTPTQKLTVPGQQKLESESISSDANSEELKANQRLQAQDISAPMSVASEHVLKEADKYQIAMGAVRNFSYTQLRDCVYEDASLCKQADSAGDTLLIVAAGIGASTLVDFLLEHGSNPSHRNKNGKSAKDMLAANPNVVNGVRDAINTTLSEKIIRG